MPESKFLAIDLGAESGRIMVGIFAKDKILLEEVHRFANNQLRIENNLLWDIPYLFREIKKGLSYAVKKGHGNIKSIGVDTWGVDFGMLDKKGELLEMPHTYRDVRTNGIPEKVYKKISAKEVYNITGIQLMRINTINQLYSIKLSNESLLNKCDKILFMPDLINYLLTGEKKSEYTIASTSQLLNAVKKNFDERIFDSLGFPLEITAPIIRPGIKIGKILPEISHETGLGEVDVIAVGGHDTASAVAAVPADGKDWAYLSSGTWSLLGIETESAIINSEFSEEFTNEGGVNNNYIFLRNITGMWILQEVKKIWNKHGEKFTYDQIPAIAASVKEFNSRIDPDDASFANPSNMIKVIDNYCVKTSQKVPSSKGEYISMIFESLAVKYKSVIDKIEKLSSTKINKIHIVGGGSKNSLLNKLTANATGKQVLAGPVEATALGNILVQIISLGEIDSLLAGRKIVSASFPQDIYFPEK